MIHWWRPLCLACAEWEPGWSLSLSNTHTHTHAGHYILINKCLLSNYLLTDTAVTHGQLPPDTHPFTVSANESILAWHTHTHTEAQIEIMRQIIMSKSHHESRQNGFLRSPPPCVSTSIEELPLFQGLSSFCELSRDSIINEGINRYTNRNIKNKHKEIISRSNVIIWRRKSLIFSTMICFALPQTGSSSALNETSADEIREIDSLKKLWLPKHHRDICPICPSLFLPPPLTPLHAPSPQINMLSKRQRDTEERITAVRHKIHHDPPLSCSFLMS